MDALDWKIAEIKHISTMCKDIRALVLAEIANATAALTLQVQDARALAWETGERLARAREYIRVQRWINRSLGHVLALWKERDAIMEEKYAALEVEYDTMRDERDQLRKQAEQAEKKLRQAHRALERHIHGEQIEGDYICPLGPVLEDTLRERDEARRERDALAAQVAEMQRALEIESLRLAACSTAAMGFFVSCADVYRSAALEDVLALRARLKQAEDAIVATELRSHSTPAPAVYTQQQEELLTIIRERDQWKERAEKAEQAKGGVYRERNALVAALSKVFPASLARHEGTTWEDDWRWVVLVDLPTGQVSWHIHDSELAEFAHLECITGRCWDGHTTAEKYRRLAALKQERDALATQVVAMRKQLAALGEPGKDS